MNRSQADKVKSETFYYVVQKSNSDTETEPQQTDEVDAALDYKVFEKIYMLGEKESGTQPLGILQSYGKLRDSYVRKSCLFVDGIFSRKVHHKIVWKRPFVSIDFQLLFRNIFITHLLICNGADYATAVSNK
jgi:hypothetical protein